MYHVAYAYSVENPTNSYRVNSVNQSPFGLLNYSDCILWIVHPVQQDSNSAVIIPELFNQSLSAAGSEKKLFLVPERPIELVHYTYNA